MYFYALIELTLLLLLLLVSMFSFSVFMNTSQESTRTVPSDVMLFSCGSWCHLCRKRGKKSGSKI